MNKPATKAAQAERDFHIIPDDDGFSLTRFIRGQDRMYPDLRFTFRPIPPLKRARVQSGFNELEAEEGLLALAKVAEKQLLSWNAAGIDGKPLPPKAESVIMLHPVLMSRLFSVVIWSTEGGDVDPARTRLQEQVRETPDLLADDKGIGGLVEESQKN